MRLFIAIELSPPARQHLERVRLALRSLAPQASWVRPENYHLTVKFLGEVEDPRVMTLCDALAAVELPGPMHLQATAMECFPPRGRINVVGVALNGTDEKLRQLHRGIDEACFEEGFPREARAYRPHATLARAKAPLPAGLREQFQDATADLWPGPIVPIERFVLMQSRLRPQGAEYTPAAHFPR